MYNKKCVLVLLHIFYLEQTLSFISPIKQISPINSRINHISRLNANNKNDFYSIIKNCNITLNDVAGLDYAKVEILEIIDFIKNKSKYEEMGAIMPKNILLHGVPGTGKTLLAKAIAGETKIPFYATSGSSFTEVYVGVGSQRVRTLFSKARENAPSIIFIDEIDAIGGKRKNSPSRNEEREGTLNQLLVELDGMETNDEVTVIAATNMIELLDDALIRSGRFDKKIITTLPNEKGRLKILKIHSKNKKISKNIDFLNFSQIMTGLSGADIQNVMNQAAIFACKSNKTEIDTNDIEKAFNQFMFGTKLTDIDLTGNMVNNIATHEIAHAIICNHFDFDKVIYVSIIPNTKGSSGITVFRPNADFAEHQLYTKEYLLSKVCVLLAGRIGEEIIYGNNKITTGAHNDLKRAQSIVSSIINEYGMGTELISSNKNDNKQTELINFLYKKTKEILISKKCLLESLSKKLLIKQEFYEKDFNELIEYYQNCITTPNLDYKTGDDIVDGIMDGIIDISQII